MPFFCLFSRFFRESKHTVAKSSHKDHSIAVEQSSPPHHQPSSCIGSCPRQTKQEKNCGGFPDSCGISHQTQTHRRQPETPVPDKTGGPGPFSPQPMDHIIEKTHQDPRTKTGYPIPQLSKDFFHQRKILPIRPPDVLLILGSL